MDYVLDFDYAAIVINLILLIFYYPRKSVPSSTNKQYRILLFATSAAAVLDVISIVQMNSKIWPLWSMYLVNILYLTSQNSLAYIFLMYTRSITDFGSHHTIRSRILCMVPYGISFILIVTSPLTDLAFTIDENLDYHQGVILPLLYVISFTYMVGTIGITTRFRKSIGRKKTTAVFIFVGCVLGAMAVQFFLPYLLITDFASACACVVMYMMLQNPEENVDSDTGFFNREAYLTLVSDYVRMDTAFAAVVVVPDNTKSISTALGFEAGKQYIKQVGDFLHRSFDTAIYLVEDECIGFVLRGNQTPAEKCVDKIKERFAQQWDVGGVQFTRTCSIGCVHYPDVATDTEGILFSVRHAISELKKNHNGMVFYVKELPTGSMTPDEFEMQKRLLEEESREANLAKEKAEQADRAKSMFLANMSHEIRTPMNAIIGMTDLILKDEISERVRQNASDIKSAGDSLLAIINDVLDISKVESGKMEICSEEYSLRKLLTDLVKLISTRIKSDEVEFIVDVDMGIPDKLYGDEVRIRQIFVNVLNNAAKFTKKGSVTLKVGGEVSGNMFILKAAVTDTGTGIREEDMHKLFNTFSRIENSETRSVEGTGLGLALCKKLLLQMGGDIGVSSVFGEGSTFSFEVPQKMGTPGSILESIKGTTSYSALILTDNSERCDSPEVHRLAETLEHLHVECRMATDNKQVEKALAEKKASHVFSYKDIYMDYADWLKDFGNPAIILFDENELKLTDVPEATILSKPVYSLNVARLLEGSRGETKASAEKFTAPDASVLIVDDNIINLKVIEGLLKLYKIVPDKASSGPEAIEKAAGRDYDLIFMDHMMPGMDGVETMHRIRENGGHNASTMIIALTANAVYGAKNMFIREGFDDYISKPIDTKKLGLLLRKCLSPDRIGSADRREKPAEVKTDRVKDGAVQDGAKEEKKVSPEAGSEKTGPFGIPNIRGIDIAKGVEQCSGNADHYKELLESFRNNGLTQGEVMERLLTGQNFGSLRIELKALKSLASSISATELAQKASNLEKKLGRGETDNVDAEFGEIKSMLESISFELDMFFADNEKSGGPKRHADKTAISEILGRALKALEDFDDEEAIGRMAELDSYVLDKNERELADRAMDRIRQFNYEKATETINTLKSALGI